MRGRLHRCAHAETMSNKIHLLRAHASFTACSLARFLGRAYARRRADTISPCHFRSRRAGRGVGESGGCVLAVQRICASQHSARLWRHVRGMRSLRAHPHGGQTFQFHFRPLQFLPRHSRARRRQRLAVRCSRLHRGGPHIHDACSRTVSRRDFPARAPPRSAIARDRFLRSGPSSRGRANAGSAERRLRRRIDAAATGTVHTAL